MSEQQDRNLKGSIVEILLIIETCLTDFWFWLPVIFAIYFYLQLFMFFYVHPLSILIMPTILSLYAIRQEKKRLQARYNLENDSKSLTLDNPEKSHGPLGFQWDIEKKVEEYQTWMKKKGKKE